MCNEDLLMHAVCAGGIITTGSSRFSCKIMRASLIVFALVLCNVALLTYYRKGGEQVSRSALFGELSARTVDAWDSAFAAAALLDAAAHGFASKWYGVPPRAAQPDPPPGRPAVPRAHRARPRAERRDEPVHVDRAGSDLEAGA